MHDKYHVRIRSFRDGFHYGWLVYNLGVQNQHTTCGTYEFHIHRAYIIYGESDVVRVMTNVNSFIGAYFMDVVHMDEKANAEMDVNKAVEEVSGYLEVT